MQDQRKRKAQLIEELQTLRARLAQLEQTHPNLPDNNSISKTPDQFKQQYPLFHDNLPIGTFSATADGKFLLANATLAKMLRYQSVEELSCSSITLFDVDPSQKELLFKRLKTNGSAVDFETRLPCKDGSSIWISATISATFDENGNLSRLDGIVQNITERKNLEAQLLEYGERLEHLVRERTAELRKTNQRLQSEIAQHKKTEEALQDSREKWRSLVQNAPNIVCTVDRNGTIQFLNRTTTSTSVKHIIGKNVRDYLLPEYHILADKAIKHVFETGTPGSYELPAKTDDGNISWYVVKTAPIKHDGQTKSVIIMATDITQQKLVCDALNDSQKRLSALLDASPANFALFDPQLNYLDVNKPALQMLGLKKEQVIGKNLLDIFPDAAKRAPYRAFKQVLKTGKPFCIDEFVPNERFGRNWLDIRAFKVGENLGVFILDITARKKAEEKLRTMQSIINRGPVALFLWRTEPGVWPVELVSENIKEIVGYTADDFTSGLLSWPDITHPDDVPRLEKEVAHFLKNGIDEWSQEYRLITSSGNVRWIRDWNKALKNSQGTVTHIQAIILDVTERKETQEKLKTERNKLQSIMEAIEYGVGIQNTDFEITYQNPVLQSIFGNHIGKKCYQVYQKNNRRCPNCPVEKAYKTGESVNFERTIVTPSGQTIILETTATPIRNSTGKIDSCLRIARNVTQQRHLEAQIAEYKERIFQAEKFASLNSITGFVAHELNQPLTVINLLLAEAIEDLQQHDNQENAVEKIKESLHESQNATDIINRLRRFTADLRTKKTDQIDLHKIAAQLTTALAEKANRAKLRVITNGLDKLPKVAANIPTIEQIFFILIQNAIEAADGKREHQLLISGKKQNQHIHLHFTDDCCGITPENLNKVFEPFFTTKSAHHCTGLGLTILKRILLNCGGNVHVQSRLGKGTTVHISLPLSQNDENR